MMGRKKDVKHSYRNDLPNCFVRAAVAQEAYGEAAPPTARGAECGVAEQVGGGGSHPILDFSSSNCLTHPDWPLNGKLKRPHDAIYRHLAIQNTTTLQG